MGEAGWGDAACIVPWSMYQLTGNIRILREQYDTMKKWCDYIINTAKKRRGKMKHPKEIDQYLWNTGHQYGEWLIPSQTVDGADQSAAKTYQYFYILRANFWMEFLPDHGRYGSTPRAYIRRIIL